MILRTVRHTLPSVLLLILWQSAGASPPTSASPSFTRAQVAAGRLVYGRACGICHGASLQGAAAVALSGSTFARTWGDGHHQGPDFFNAIAKQMPKNAPGTLSEADNLDLTAFILGSNGYAAGPQPLTLAALAGPMPAAPGAQSGMPSAATDTAAATFPQAPRSVRAASSNEPGDAQLLHVPDQDWLTFNRTLAGERFTPLA
jgi:mono/diheme cytochrome c family protein